MSNIKFSHIAVYDDMFLGFYSTHLLSELLRANLEKGLRCFEHIYRLTRVSFEVNVTLYVYDNVSMYCH